MKAEIEIGKGVKSKGAEVDAETLVIDLDKSPRRVAEAMLRDLKSAIELQPGDKWDRTGELKNGLHISSDGTEVLAPDGRLDRAEVRRRFRDDVMVRDPFDSPAVQRAIDVWLGEVIGGAK